MKLRRKAGYYLITATNGLHKKYVVEIGDAVDLGEKMRWVANWIEKKEKKYLREKTINDFDIWGMREAVEDVMQTKKLNMRRVRGENLKRYRKVEFQAKKV